MRGRGSQDDGGRGGARGRARPAEGERDRRRDEPRAERDLGSASATTPTSASRSSTGGGERFFCAGWDLKAAAAGEESDADWGVGGFGGLNHPRNLYKPIVAAVNGIACGGGFELMLGCDLIVADEHARFALPEIKVGVLPDAASVKLRRRIPYHVAVELLMTGRWMDVAEAKHWGLVNEVVPARRRARARARARADARRRPAAALPRDQAGAAAHRDGHRARGVRGARRAPRRQPGAALGGPEGGHARVLGEARPRLEGPLTGSPTRGEPGLRDVHVPGCSARPRRRSRRRRRRSTLIGKPPPKITRRSMPPTAPAASGGSSLMKSCQRVRRHAEADRRVGLVLRDLHGHERGAVHAAERLEDAGLVADRDHHRRRDRPRALLRGGDHRGARAPSEMLAFANVPLMAVPLPSGAPSVRRSGARARGPP